LEYAGQGLLDAQEAKAKSEITSASEARLFIKYKLVD
jgi:hypothetical protein